MAKEKKKAEKKEAPKKAAPLSLAEAIEVIDKMPLASVVVRDNKKIETLPRKEVLELLKRVK